jgi:hypothetical protein
VSGGDGADDTKERIMDQVLALIRAGLRAELGPGFRFGTSAHGLVVRRVLR